MYSPAPTPTASDNAAATSFRHRQLVFPREHGAWGMLFIPLLTGAWIGVADGGTINGVAWFVLAAFALFCVRTPFESLLGTTPIRVANGEERQLTIRFVGVFGFITVVALSRLLWHGAHPGLLLLGAVVAVLLVAQMLVKRLGRGGRMPSQVIGALALTATAPGAYYAATNHLDVRALGLWFANWVFAGNQIHFVQLRLRASKCRNWDEKFARGRGFFVGQIVMIAALAGAWWLGIVPPLVLIAFVPVFVRGVVWFFRPPEPLALHRLGMTELAHSVAFGVLLVVGLLSNFLR
jgi:YwiC-like protein